MRIAILSRGRRLYSTQRLKEAAEKRGHEVNVVDYLKCQAIIDGGRPAIYYHSKELELFDAIIPRIGASRTFYGCAIVRQFEAMKVFTTAKSQNIGRSRDKLRCLQMLSKQGIGLPNTAFCSDTMDVNQFLNKIGGPPIILKLLEGTQGKGVILAETKKAAKSAVEAFQGLKINILLQEYIEEAKGCDLRAIVVDYRVVGSIKRTGAVGEFRSNLHLGGSAEVVKLSKEEKATAISAARAMGLAVAGVDMLQSARGPLVMEVNSSPGLEGIESSTGKDIAGEIIRYIEKNAQKKQRKKSLQAITPQARIA